MTTGIGIGFTGEGLALEEIVELGVQADTAGLDSVWHAENQRDPWVPLSVIAARTSQIRIGTGIALWARSPVVTELAAANLDELSRGRFVLGLGTGPRQRNEEWYRVPYDAPVERMREYVELLRLMWTAHSGSTVDYLGRQLPLKGYRRAIKPYRSTIPIYLGVVRRRMLELAGELADGVLLDSLTTPAYLAHMALPHLSAGLARGGRSRGDIEVAAFLITAVHPDLAQARAWARPQVAYYLVGTHADPIIRLEGFERQAERLRSAASAGNSEAMIAAVDDETLDALAVVGPPERCRARLEQFKGLDLAVLMPPAFRLGSEEIQANVGAIFGAFGS